MSSTHHTKVLILGSGPAGCTAAIYAARAGFEPIMVCGMQPGGQLTITTDVENYPGFADPIQGPFLMQEMEKQAKNVGTKIIYDHIHKVDFSKKPFICYGESGDEYIGDSVIICTGAQAKWLGLESEKKFQGFGVSGCATCDGPFFRNQEIVVIGGGNSAVEEAIYLTHHASKVTLIHRRDTLRAEKIAQERLFKNPKISVIWDSAIEEITGTEGPLSVTGVKIKNLLTEEKTELAVTGVFVAIGHTPNTKIFKGFLDMDEEGYIITVNNSTKTNIVGIYAAGDV
jgi:thioredoxin reductase (NADPH)